MSWRELCNDARWQRLRAGGERWVRAIGFTVVVCSTGVNAEAAGTLTVDLPIRGPLVFPEGLMAAPRQVTSPDGRGYAEFLLMPAAKRESLFITVIFEEDGTEGPSMFWTGEVSGDQVTLSTGLAEGVSGLNRRTVRLPEEVLGEAGRIYLSGDQRKILRVRLDWVAPTGVFVATDEQRPDLIAGGRVFFDQEMTGGEALAPPDSWFGDVLDASLLEGVESLDGNVEFAVPLSGPGEQALLRAKFMGLAPGAAVKVWVNGKLAGRLQPVVPALTDAGYIRLRSGRMAYAGWREGSILLEDGLLKAGENSIVIETAKKRSFIRDAALQLRVRPVTPEESLPKPEEPTVEISSESVEMR